MEINQKYLGEIPSNVKYRLGRDKLYFKTDQWPILQKEIESLSDFKFSSRMTDYHFWSQPFQEQFLQFWG